MKIKTILFSLFLSMSQMAIADDNANDILDQVRKDLTSMSADFEQYQIDDNQRMSEITTGKMWLNEPNQFKWEYIDPAPQLIVANGKKIWIFDEDLEQVTIKQQDNTQNPIYVLLNKEQTEINYFIENWQDGADSQGIQWISLTPKVPNDEIKQVWLGLSDNSIRVLKFKNQLDNIDVFMFNNVIRNPELPDDFFTFTPPDGIDIISDAMGI